MENKTKNESVDKLINEISHMLFDYIGCDMCEQKEKESQKNVFYSYKDELENALKALREKELELENFKKQGRDTYKKITSESESLKKLLKDKLLADTYLVCNDIKSCIAFAEKCGLLDDVDFMSMMEAVLRNANLRKA